jgi:hypothetical protein
MLSVNCSSSDVDYERYWRVDSKRKPLPGPRWKRPFEVGDYVMVPRMKVMRQLMRKMISRRLDEVTRTLCVGDSPSASREVARAALC